MLRQEKLKRRSYGKRIEKHLKKEEENVCEKRKTSGKEKNCGKIKKIRVKV